MKRFLQLMLIGWIASIGTPERVQAKAQGKSDSKSQGRSEVSDSHLRLGVLGGFPEFRALTLGWDWNRQLSFQALYAPIMPIHVDLDVPSKKLVEQEGIAIRSPQLTLPFAMDFGPQWSLGTEWHPWSGSLFLGAAFAHRVTKVESHMESPLIFEHDGQQQSSNTQFAADLWTRTEQDLLRLTVGQRWNTPSIFWGWSIGQMKPLRARSKVSSRVQVLNPMASDTNDQSADNLETARIAQQEFITDQVGQYLRKYEDMALPLLGFEIGLRF